jgi:hypothetical protein
MERTILILVSLRSNPNSPDHCVPEHSMVVFIITNKIKHSMPKIFEVCTRKSYEKDGEKKVKWYKAGYIKETDKGTRYLRLFQQPHTNFFIFEREQPQEEAQG